MQTWHDVLALADQLPARLRAGVLEEVQRCLAALAAGNIDYFVHAFARSDTWRIVAHFIDEATFFDIETTGLEIDAPITVIMCWHRGRLHAFVEHENLDGFLELLDDVRLLISFNGASFDVPRVLDAFHIPQLPCPHLDLRWSLYHRGCRGSLKDIAARAGIRRPEDLRSVDGAWAIQLWEQWVSGQDPTARQQLLRYCAADVLMLVMLAQRMASRASTHDALLWAHLPPVDVRPVDVPTREVAAAGPLPSHAFGAASPGRLRALVAQQFYRQAVG
ncbi:MAG: ribonuclease H-like domain-containing protein [Pirellulaceae bacterium]